MKSDRANRHGAAEVPVNRQIIAAKDLSTWLTEIAIYW